MRVVFWAAYQVIISRVFVCKLLRRISVNISIIDLNIDVSADGITCFQFSPIIMLFVTVFITICSIDYHVFAVAIVCSESEFNFFLQQGSL